MELRDELTAEQVKQIVAEIDAWHASYEQYEQSEKWQVQWIEQFYALPVEAYNVRFESGLVTLYVRNLDGLLRPAVALAYYAPHFDRSRFAKKQEGQMPFFHAMYAPFHRGDRVIVLETQHQDKHGTIKRVEPEDMLDGEMALYWLVFDGDSQECLQSFGFWQLELEEQ